MKRLDELARLKEAALKDGNVTLYAYYDGAFMEHLASVLPAQVQKQYTEESKAREEAERWLTGKEVPECLKPYLLDEEKPKKDDTRFADKVYTLRKRMKMSQRALGAYLGVMQKSICDWEHGRKPKNNAKNRQIIERIERLYAEEVLS